MEVGTPVQQILLYYGLLLPTYLPYLLPVSLLLALLYALWQLGKNSELTAMRACGLSLTQLIMPYLLTGMAAAFFLLAVNELLNPWATHWTRQFQAMQGSPHAAQTYLGRQPRLQERRGPADLANRHLRPAPEQLVRDAPGAPDPATPGRVG
jgi:lipopolysaccharide export LptBFGC system permease protein LptF